MLLPIRTNIRPERTPYLNYALLAANVIIFFMTYGPHGRIVAGQIEAVAVRHWAERFMLHPDHPAVWQFVSYAFLHANGWHIFGNMFFLFLFGNNVNSKLGHLGYLCFYLAGAVFSAIGHTILVDPASAVPTLGASGAVAAVTGAYLVLFPQTLITVLYWFFFIGTIEVPALYFIAFKLILIDNIIARTHGDIAYNAHLAGYAFGIIVLLLMLAARLVGTSNFDLWSMIKRWNRRRHYRDVVAGGYDPFTPTGPGVRRIKVKEVKSESQQLQERTVQQLRNEIAARVAQRNLSAAAQLYLDLMDVDSSQVLSRRHLLDIANQLASDRKNAEAAQAYEQFLANYGTYEYAEQVRLMLGLLYARYLNEPEKAVRHLKAAMEKLTDQGQVNMCKEELARLQS